MNAVGIQILPDSIKYILPECTLYFYTKMKKWAIKADNGYRSDGVYFTYTHEALGLIKQWRN